MKTKEEPQTLLDKIINGHRAYGKDKWENDERFTCEGSSHAEDPRLRAMYAIIDNLPTKLPTIVHERDRALIGRALVEYRKACYEFSFNYDPDSYGDEEVDSCVISRVLGEECSE